MCRNYGQSVTADLGYIDALRDKIAELERLNKIKESENKILREVLEEIGAKITSEVDKHVGTVDDEFCVLLVRTNEIFLRKAYMYPYETEEALRRIDEALLKNAIYETSV